MFLPEDFIFCLFNYRVVRFPPEDSNLEAVLRCERGGINWAYASGTLMVCA